MGCDIHMYPEFKLPTDDRWDSFAYGSFNPGRNYSVFACLAGVRGDAEPVAQPRGVPEDMGWTARDDYWMLIDYEGGGGDKTCTPESAERWHEMYGCAYEGEVKPLIWSSTTFVNGLAESACGVHGAAHDGKPRFISDPDAHTASWVTLNEFEEALNRSRWPNEVHEYRAILAAMRHLESNGYQTRIVFWFDN